MFLLKKFPILCLRIAPMLMASLFCSPALAKISQETIAQNLGWVADPNKPCGGYYLDSTLKFPENVDKKEVFITGNQGLFSQNGTSVFNDELTISYQGQEISANKAYLYRSPETKELTEVEFISDVRLQDATHYALAHRGTFNFQTKAKSLYDLLYRTTVYSQNGTIVPLPAGTSVITGKISTLAAWGEAKEFSQKEARVTELDQASYSTCAPISPFWQLKAGHIVLDKNIGRGTATHARVYIKSVPIFYTPYINFPIDARRETGILTPVPGISSKAGPYLALPFYWNMAPNYDMTITPAFLSKRGLQLNDLYRYLTPNTLGKTNITVLPNDKAFKDFQLASQEDFAKADNIQAAELNRLMSAGTTRYSLSWQNNTRFNDHWFTHINYNRVSDDYYFQDFGSDINETTENQLLQEGTATYKGENWNFIGRVQAYQTLHPLSQSVYENQYRRLPQLFLKGDYPNQPLGLEYFIANEVTHFTIQNNPGVPASAPAGDRFNIQPGISWPYTLPYFYLTPRAQVALTKYTLAHQPAGNSNSIQRAVPILDIHSGLTFDRQTSIFSQAYKQTLEPQFYYTYVPFRNQSEIPTFDTNVNTLTYDQLFNYNRFSGIDRIGDANQLSLGIVTRLIDKETGLEKLRAGVGDIIYFTNRRVTLCNDPEVCTDNPENSNNRRRLSPLSGMLKYNVNPSWSLTGDTIWNPQTKKVDNGTVMLHYQPEPQKIINVGYNFARNGDILSGLSVPTTPSEPGINDNIKLTDFSFSWPLLREYTAVGRWSQDWNKSHFQEILYGLQYDTCCWAVRMVGGRQFTGLNPDNSNPEYNTKFYIQFALKGLGNIGSGNPEGLLSNITGYRSQFGQET